MYALQLLADGRLLSACGDGLLAWWPPDLPALDEPVSGTALARLPANVFALAEDPQTKSVLAGGLRGGLFVIPLNSDTSKAAGNQPFRALGNPDIPVYALLQDSHRQQVWVGRGDGVLDVWDPPTWTCKKSLALSTGRIRSLALHPNLPLLAVAASDGKIQLLHTTTFQVERRWSAHSRSVFSVQFSPDGQRLISGSMDASIRVWDAAEGYRLAQDIPAHLLTVNDLLYCSSGEWIISASRDRTIKCWSAGDLELRKVLAAPRDPGHTRSVNALCLLPQSQCFASASDDRNIAIWRFKETGK